MKSLIILFYFLSIISQLFIKPLFIRKGPVKFQKFLFVTMLLSFMLRKYSFTHFLLRTTHLFFCFLYSFFTFFIGVFTKFISKFSKSTSGVIFFPRVSSHTRSLISPYKLLFQRCMVTYDVNESVG